MGADREPGRRQAVDADGPGGAGHGARRARPVEAARADDAHDRPRAAHGPGLRTDHEALPRAPRRARRRVREGVVQAAAPRHGAGVALPRPVGPGAAALAGPGARPSTTSSSTTPTSPRSRRRSSAPGCRSRSSSRPRGRRPRASAAPTSAAAPTARASGSRRRRTGWSTSRPRWPRCCRRSRAIQQDFNAQSGGKRVSLADVIVLGGVRRGRAGGEGRRPRRDGAVRTGPHRRLAGADRRGVVRGARADRRRVPQLPPRGREAARRRRCCSTGPTC